MTMLYAAIPMSFDIAKQNTTGIEIRKVIYKGNLIESRSVEANREIDSVFAGEYTLWLIT